MGSAGNFGAEVAEWTKKAGASADQVIRKTALDVFGRVIRMTPVGDLYGGTHRGSWFASTGDPITGRTGNDSGGNQTISAASAVITGAEQDSDFYLSNSAPAINVLEYGGYPTRGDGPPSNGPRTVNGYSRQAPAGMVRVTIAEFDSHFKRNASAEGFN